MCSPPPPCTLWKLKLPVLSACSQCPLPHGCCRVPSLPGLTGKSSELTALSKTFIAHIGRAVFLCLSFRTTIACPCKDGQKLSGWPRCGPACLFSRPSTVAVGSVPSDQPRDPMIPHLSHPSFGQSIKVDFPSSSAEWFSLASWAQAVYLRRPLETHFSPSNHLIARFFFFIFFSFLPWHYQDSANGQRIQG